MSDNWYGRAMLADMKAAEAPAQPPQERRVLARGWTVVREGEEWSWFDAGIWPTTAKAWEDYTGIDEPDDCDEARSEYEAQGARAVYVEIREADPPEGSAER